MLRSRAEIIKEMPIGTWVAHQGSDGTMYGRTADGGIYDSNYIDDDLIIKWRSGAIGLLGINNVSLLRDEFDENIPPELLDEVKKERKAHRESEEYNPVDSKFH